LLTGGDTRLPQRGVVEIDGSVDDRNPDFRVTARGLLPQRGQARDIRYRIHTRIPATPAQLLRLVGLPTKIRVTCVNSADL